NFIYLFIFFLVLLMLWLPDAADMVEWSRVAVNVLRFVSGVLRGGSGDDDSSSDGDDFGNCDLTRPCTTGGDFGKIYNLFYHLIQCRSMLFNESSSSSRSSRKLKMEHVSNRIQRKNMREQQRRQEVNEAFVRLGRVLGVPKDVKKLNLLV